MGPDIETLIQKISRLPGLGQRSARRIVVHMIKNKKHIFEPILNSMRKVSETVKTCPKCFNVDSFSGEVCSICSDNSRKKDTICIVENVADLHQQDKLVFRHDLAEFAVTLVVKKIKFPR